jgi:transposase InsO family protein
MAQHQAPWPGAVGGEVWDVRRRGLYAELQAAGAAVGRAKARRLRQAAGVMGRRPTPPRPLTTDSRHGYGVAPTRLARPFDSETPDHVWAGDLTDGWTAEGGLSVSVRWDLSSRTVVGGALRRHLDAALGQDAWPRAVGRRQPPRGLLHHADRGSP